MTARSAATLRPAGGGARTSAAFREHAAIEATPAELVVTDRDGRTTRFSRTSDHGPAAVAATARTPVGRVPRLLDLEVLDAEGRTLVHAPLGFDLGQVHRFARDAGLAYRTIEGRPPPVRPDCVYLDGSPSRIVRRRVAVIVAAILVLVGAALLTNVWIAAALALAVVLGGLWWSR